MRRLFLTMCMVVLGAPLGLQAGDLSPAHAVNSFGRWIGYGWSRGYHTHDNCGTPRCFSQATIMEAVPESQSEKLPPPKTPSVLNQPTPAKQSSRRTYQSSPGNLLKPAEITPIQPSVAPDWQIPAEEARLRRTYGMPR